MLDNEIDASGTETIPLIGNEEDTKETDEKCLEVRIWEKGILHLRFRAGHNIA